LSGKGHGIDAVLAVTPLEEHANDAMRLLIGVSAEAKAKVLSNSDDTVTHRDPLGENQRQKLQKEGHVFHVKVAAGLGADDVELLFLDGPSSPGPVHGAIAPGDLSCYFVKEIERYAGQLAHHAQ
jgi:hypothetical protein